MKKKILVACLCVALAVLTIAGTTLAYLTATTGPVKNTFTVGNINITLAETKTDFKMVPGCTIDKDPKVTVVAGSEKCYLFVKLEKSSNFDSFMTYSMADGWTQLKDTEENDVAGVFYREVATDGMGTAFSVLAGDKVSVRDTVTKTDMENLTAATYPTLTVTAYACQYQKDNTTPFTAAEAWNNVNSAT